MPYQFCIYGAVLIVTSAIGLALYDSERDESGSRLTGLKIAFVGGLIAIGLGIIASIGVATQEAADKQLETDLNAIQSRFTPLLDSFEEQARQRPDEVLQVNAADRERLKLEDRVNVIFGICPFDDELFVVIENWNGSDYQWGGNGTFYGQCGGRDTRKTFDDFSRSPWYRIEPDSFNYEEAAPKLHADQTQVAEMTAAAATYYAPTVTATP